MNIRDLEIVYTYHALDRCKERTIQEEMVLETLEKPYKEFPNKDGTKTVAVRYFSKSEKLCHFVVYVVERGKLVVVSSYIRDNNGYRSYLHGRNLCRS